MADNVAITSGAGTTVATDDVAGVHYQRVKLVDGTLDSSAAIPGDATNGLDVDVTRVQGTVTVGDGGGSLTVDGSVSLAAAIPAGTNNIGDVDVLTVPAPLSTTGGGTEAAALRVTLASDSTGLVSVDDNGGSLTVDGTVSVSGNVTVVQSTASSLNVTVGAALPAGSNAIGKLAANSGVDIGDVDVTSVTPGTAAANLGKAEDAAHASGDTGVMALAVRNDSGATTFGANGDYMPIAVDAAGRVGIADLGGAISVDDNGTTLSIDDGAGSITVDGTVKWGAPESIATALSTELNSLADNAYSNASGAIDNATDPYEFMMLELNLASLTPTGSPSISVFAVPTVDGTNYVDGGGAVAPPAENLLAVFTLSTSTGAQRRAVTRVSIDPVSFKLVARNKAGAALGGSGNTLKYRRYNRRMA